MNKSAVRWPSWKLWFTAGVAAASLAALYAFTATFSRTSPLARWYFDTFWFVPKDIGDSQLLGFLSGLVVGGLVRINILAWVFVFAADPLRAWLRRMWSSRPTRVLLCAAAGFQLLMMLTYPLFVSGDGVSYWAMAGDMSVLVRRSNLVHSPGYPFLLSWFFLLEGTFLDPYTVLFLQSACYVAQALMLYEIGSHFLRPAWSFAAALLFSLSVSLSALVHHARPEFLAGFLFTMSLWFYLRSLVNDERGLWLAAWAGIAGSVALLVRPNGSGSYLWLAALMGAQGFFARLGMQAWFRLAAFLVGLAFPFGSYIVFYHRPATGTYKYSYGMGMHLANHWSRAQSPFPDTAAGPANVQLKEWLDRPMPMVPEVEFQPILTLWSRLRLPTDPIPSKYPWKIAGTMADDYYPVNLLYYVYGHKDANALLINASIEKVLKDPLGYVKHIVRFLWEDFREGGGVRLPRTSDLRVEKELFLGFVRAQTVTENRVFHQDKVSLYFWPGVRLFQSVNDGQFPRSLLLFAVLLAPAVSLILRRTMVPVLAVGGGILAFLIPTYMVSMGTYKAVLPVFPLCLFLMIFVAQEIVGVFPRRFRASSK